MDEKAFPCHRKANVFLYCLELKENSLLNQKQTCQQLTPGYHCEAKGVIFYTFSSERFRGKNSQPSMAIMTIYGAVFCVLLLENFTSGVPDGKQVNKHEF